MGFKPSSVFNTTPLRVLFWMSWAGTVLFFLVVPFPFVGHDFNEFGYSFVNGLVAVLCFTSAFFVQRQPRLALLGALTLALPVVIILVVILINVIFHLITGKA